MILSQSVFGGGDTREITLAHLRCRIGGVTRAGRNTRHAGVGYILLAIHGRHLATVRRRGVGRRLPALRMPKLRNPCLLLRSPVRGVVMTGVKTVRVIAPVPASPATFSGH